MSQTKVSLGQAIDQIISALESFDDKARETIVATVCAHLGITLAAGTSAVVPPPKTPHAGEDSLHVIKSHDSKVGRLIDVRALKDQKQPKSAIQMACLVAYYLSEHASDTEKKNTVKTEDLEKYFKHAGYKLPQKINQVLVDAKAAGYFDSAGRGEYKLNAVGYNLVVHSMPTTVSAK